MRFRNAVACAFAALAVVGGAGGTAQAADDDTAKFDNSEVVASCSAVEIIDQPNLGPSENNVDCSSNVKDVEARLTHTVGHALFPAGRELR